MKNHKAINSIRLQVQQWKVAMGGARRSAQFVPVKYDVPRSNRQERRKNAAVSRKS